MTATIHSRLSQDPQSIVVRDLHEGIKLLGKRALVLGTQIFPEGL